MILYSLRLSQTVHVQKCSCLSPLQIIKTKQDLYIVGIENDFISVFLAEKGVWEKRQTDFFVTHVRSGEIVLDLGANIGYYTTLLAKLVGSSGKIYSYEANPELGELVHLSLTLNNLRDIVDFRNYAVSNQTTRMNFTYHTIAQSSKGKVNIGMSHLTRTGNQNGDYYVKEVKTVSLDDDLPNLQNIDWLRMDIEGAEILALYGARRIIQSSPKIKIVMEWYPQYLSLYGNLSKLIDDLHEEGFSFYDTNREDLFEHPLSKNELLTFQVLDPDLLLTRSRGI